MAGVRLNLESNEDKNKKSVDHTYDYAYVCLVGRNGRWGKNIPQTKKGSLATLFFFVFPALLLVWCEVRLLV